MPGLDPGIHVFLFAATQDVDGRDKPGHDERNYRSGKPAATMAAMMPLLASR
jgi:hypothetical protein